MGKDIPTSYDVLPNHRDEREYEKFGLDDEGFVYVRTSVFGEIRPSGLDVAIKTTTMTVGSTAVALPATALEGRNSIILHNKSITETLYIGNDDVTADTVNGTTSGYELAPGAFFNIDITDNIVIYGITEGATITVKVTEVA